MTAAVRSLLFSTLYPSAARPNHGIFVETRLRELLKTGAVQARVVAPVPWFPSRAERFGDYARMAQTPPHEQRHGVDVLHPRYLLLPKVGMLLAPWLLALSCIRPLRKLIQEGFDFDVIDSHYFYPDGVAAALLAVYFKKPLVITARGSDVNLIARFALPRRLMLWASRRAAACIGVSAALVEAMAQMGVPSDRLRTMRNGVDLQRFHPIDPTQARSQIGFTGAPLLLSVGNLVPLKGHELCIDALALLKAMHAGARLLIVGHGPERERLLAHAQQRGVAGSVHLVGTVPNAELAAWYSAADVLLLASNREGWPNVLLEAMACGTPVVATAVGGVPEVVRADVAGSLVQQRTGQALANGVLLQLQKASTRSAVRCYAEAFGWEQTSRQQAELFGTLAGQGVAHA